jgi:hypothetical protein
MRNCKILPMNKMSFQVKISSGEMQFLTDLISLCPDFNDT